ncbi:MAG TPA: hypothetical protein VGN57_18635 [Pirellulaceae bacterium]|jgi:hypothetical protein|nr:hypothetical protein [Pirellulaceae bacterium]
MKTRIRYAFVFAVVAFATFSGGFLLQRSVPQVAAAEPAAEAAQPEPVEADMHEFMEYQFQPVYLRLKQSLAKAPADRAGWKGVKSDSLILAEGGNLLLLRKPDADAADWDRYSVETRQHGGDLYRAAKASDYPAARKHYEAMLVSCNACHTQFADGKHQLKP